MRTQGAQHSDWPSPCLQTGGTHTLVQPPAKRPATHLRGIYLTASSVVYSSALGASSGGLASAVCCILHQEARIQGRSPYKGGGGRMVLAGLGGGSHRKAGSYTDHGLLNMSAIWIVSRLHSHSRRKNKIVQSLGSLSLCPLAMGIYTTNSQSNASR